MRFDLTADPTGRLIPMSIRAMNWAWQVPLPPAPKLVLLALADIADDGGTCWPGLNAIAGKCSITTRTVQRIIAALDDQSLLLIEPRYRADGSRTSNRYRLPLDTPHDKLSPGGGADVRGATTPVSWGGDTGVVARTTTEPSIDPPLPPSIVGARQYEVAGGGGGDFIFPQGSNPAQCAALRARVTTLSGERAQQILDELAGRMQVSEVKNPIRYCATLVQRAQRGRFVPELALKIAEQRQAEVARMSRREQLDQPAGGTTVDVAKRLPNALQAPLDRMRLRATGAAPTSDQDSDRSN
jgi:hypothetical protein